MKIQQLIDLLKQFPPDTGIFVRYPDGENDSCYGPLQGVEVHFPVDDDAQVVLYV